MGILLGASRMQVEQRLRTIHQRFGVSEQPGGSSTEVFTGSSGCVRAA